MREWLSIYFLRHSSRWKMMSPSPVEPVDLLDLKLLPAWVKEPAKERIYEYASGEEDDRRSRSPNRSGRDRAPRSRESKMSRESQNGRNRRVRGRNHEDQRKVFREIAPAEITVRFLPHLSAFDNVVAQIKSASVAYSIFALARLFLEKPERYDVRLTTKAESPVYQLAENGAISPDRDFLERNAVRFAREDFYKIDTTQSDPIKGNFSNVARCRLSGTLLGPTNHHNYQPQLRSLYEQRFSRRMSFADYQRQIEIVSDTALIERWKEEARKVTTYTTLREETALTFSSAVEAERHFRSHYLPGLIHGVGEMTIGGALSRRLPDRTINRVIEEAWAQETRSPSNMMQELAGRFRHNGLHIFRHRRGMLFVSPIRVRAFVHEHASVSASVNAILEAVAAAPAMNRQQLLKNLIGDSASEDGESRKLALASDLRWLINEGYVIEFNDGSLDLPRTKARPQEVAAVVEPAPNSSSGSTRESMQQAVAAASASTTQPPTALKESAELFSS